MGTSSIAAARRACSSAAIIPLTMACKIPSMSRTLTPTVALALAASALMIAACRRPDQTSSGKGFQERAREAGIEFRMHDLPKEQGETFHINLHDRGAGTFEDVTAAAGLTRIGHFQTPVFFDYDNDGKLDLFLTNTGRWTTDVFDSATHAFEGKPDLGTL